MPFGDCSILSKHNRYLAAVLQRIYRAVIVVNGYVINHGVPQLFVKLNGWCINLGELLKVISCIVLFYRSVSRLFTQINTKLGCIVPINAKILFRNY